MTIKATIRKEFFHKLFDALSCDHTYNKSEYNCVIQQAEEQAIGHMDKPITLPDQIASFIKAHR